jgi:hypothetical protein
MVLDAWIQIEKVKVNRQQTLPNQVCFHFDDNLLREIKLWQENHKQMQLSWETITDFRYYVLLNHQSNFPVELTFCSYYQQAEQQIAVIQSQIFLDGKITQQIRHDYLQKFQLLHRVMTAHYWAIEQMLNQLKIKSLKPNQLLFSILSLAFTIIVALILLLASIELPIVLIISFIIWVILKLAIKHLLLPNLHYFILQQLLFGVFSSPTKMRKIGFYFLDRFTFY